MRAIALRLVTENAREEREREQGHGARTNGAERTDADSADMCGGCKVQGLGSFVTSYRIVLCDRAFVGGSSSVRGRAEQYGGTTERGGVRLWQELRLAQVLAHDHVAH